MRTMVGICLLGCLSLTARADSPADAPDVHALMQQVMAHQKELEKVRENYTWHTAQVSEVMDKNGHVTKTEQSETEVFYVNGHHIERTISKDGKPLSGHEADKEQERINKLVAKAQSTPPDKSLESGETISVSRLLDIMEVTHQRRESFRGRPTVIFDFAGKHDAKTHGIAEDASKKIAGTMWVDEKDKQVVRMEAHFTDNFHVAGGLLANIEKGSSFYFDQALVNGEIWLPVDSEGRMDVRLLLVKGMHGHFTERDTGYKRFSVDAEPGKVSTVAAKN